MELITRAAARERGLKRYFTGLSCGRGHVAERLVSNLGCVECARERRPASESKNRESINAAMREYRAKNAEKMRASDRARREAKKALMPPKPPKPPVSERRSSYYRANRELIKAKAREWHEKNQEKNNQRSREYRARNLCSINEKRRAAYRSGDGGVAASAAKRRAAKRQAVPTWFGELDELVWLEAADLVKRRHAATGIKWAADHMIPLRARQASGLHTWNNCQVIPARLNAAKLNKMILVMPLEWLRRI